MVIISVSIYACTPLYLLLPTSMSTRGWLTVRLFATVCDREHEQPFASNESARERINTREYTRWKRKEKEKKFKVEEI